MGRRLIERWDDFLADLPEPVMFLMLLGLAVVLAGAMQCALWIARAF